MELLLLPHDFAQSRHLARHHQYIYKYKYEYKCEYKYEYKCKYKYEYKYKCLGGLCACGKALEKHEALICAQKLGQSATTDSTARYVNKLKLVFQLLCIEMERRCKR